jgi:DNA (cytosine-5)-methyltransferase 1
VKAISLFSGAGGMDLGAHAAGFDVVFANDIMREAAETHATFFPGVEFVTGDVKGLTSFPEADLVMGGYPCQSFSMGGLRRPQHDSRTQLYEEFARCVDLVSPKYFVAENVSGLKQIANGHWLEKQLALFQTLGRKGGYNVTWAVMRAENHGVPQRRKRLFIVGVRRDLGLFYWFPAPTHGKPGEAQRRGLAPFASHGDAISGMPLWPTGEFYERPHDPEGHMSWYYMSRNRKAPWDAPSFTIVANFRHITLHPASQTMKLVWSNLADGFKQKWEFSGEWEHLEDHPDRPKLQTPRRLSWRECARIQTFPPGFEPAGDLARKFELIGNAVPPLLADAVLRPLAEGGGLRSAPPPQALAVGKPVTEVDQLEMAL